jgi:hypothetical protein
MPSPGIQGTCRRAVTSSLTPFLVSSTFVFELSRALIDLEMRIQMKDAVIKHFLQTAKLAIVYFYMSFALAVVVCNDGLRPGLPRVF